MSGVFVRYDRGAIPSTLADERQASSSDLPELPPSTLTKSDGALPTRAIRFLAVDPGMQRQGVAAWLLKLAESNAARREPQKRVLMVLDTVKEVNAGFYGRRGWRAVRDVPVPPGSGNSPSGYTTVYMDKLVSH